MEPGPRPEADTGDRAYYSTDGGIECWQALRACLGREGYLAWLRGTIMKYGWRVGKKQTNPPEEDAVKMGWYTRELERVLADPAA